jgi:hypothetical protein
VEGLTGEIASAAWAGIEAFIGRVQALIAAGALVAGAAGGSIAAGDEVGSKPGSP